MLPVCIGCFRPGCAGVVAAAFITELCSINVLDPQLGLEQVVWAGEKQIRQEKSI